MIDEPPNLGAKALLMVLAAALIYEAVRVTGNAVDRAVARWQERKARDRHEDEHESAPHDGQRGSHVGI